MSSSNPRGTVRLLWAGARHRSRLRRAAHARSGTLSIMVGGDETAVGRIALALATMEANSEAHKQLWTAEFAVTPAVA